MRICVVGAGLSGLVAADLLNSAEHDVILLEARNRVGGRVWTQKLPSGSIIERGAEYIDLEQHALLFTLARLGLSLAPAGTSYTAREPRGGIGTTIKEMSEAVDVVKTLIAKEPLRLLNQSAAELLSDADISSGAREAIASRVQITTAYPVDKVHAYALIHIGFGTSEGLRVAGGNQSVALRLAERLGDERVLLSHPVTRIRWSQNGVTLESGQDSFSCKACIITVPASVISKIHFDPELPRWKEEAFRNVAYGHAAKLYIPLTRVPPPSSVHSVPDHYWTWTAKDESGNVQPVVSAFAGSAQSLERLEVKNGPKKWVENLRKLRPDLELDSENVLLSTWDDEPWVEAAYSARPLNLPLSYDEILSRPIGPLHFAGEHTAGQHSSTMDGAVRSGIRAAGEIMITP